MAFLTIFASAAIALLVIATILWTVLLSPAARADWVLRRQAVHDYRTARGTIHLGLLRTALKKQYAERNLCLCGIRDWQSRGQLTRQQADNEVAIALQSHIVEAHFHEVQGIGPTLRREVLAAVFRGQLVHLYGASRVRGIGAQR
jgi:hypothetical protein